MTDIDPILRWRQAMQHGSRPAPDRGDCPDADTLALLIAQPEAAPDEVLAHVERCSACAGELKSLAELPELEAMIERMAPRRSPLRRWVPLAAAACLALAVGVAGYLVIEEPSQPVVRNVPAVSGITPVEGAVLDRAPEAMTWSAREDQRYRVTLHDAQAVRVWVSDSIEAGRVTLPEEVRQSLGPGRYYWQLHVVDRGTVQGPFAFEIVQAMISTECVNSTGCRSLMSVRRSTDS